MATSLLVSKLILAQQNTDTIVLKSSDIDGYEFGVWNDTKKVYRFFIDDEGRACIGNNAPRGTLTVTEDSADNSVFAATIINSSNTGSGIEIMAGKGSDGLILDARDSDDNRVATIAPDGKVTMKFIKIDGGTPAVGHILTAIDTEGNAEWAEPAVAYSPDGTTITAEADGVMTVVPDAPLWDLANENALLLAGLLYKDATVSLSVSPSLFEFGLSTSTTLTVSWSSVENGDTIQSFEVSNLDGTETPNGSGTKDVTTSTSFTLTATRIRTDNGELRPALTTSRTATATIPKFWGTSSSNTYPATNPYTDLNKLIQTSGSISEKTFVANNEYCWFISTKSGATVIDQNNFPQTTWVETAIDMELPDGSTVTAYHYVSPGLVNEASFGIRLT